VRLTEVALVTECRFVDSPGRVRGRSHFPGQTFLLRSQLTSEASAALRATGVAATPNVARVTLTRQSGENVVPKRFRIFISIYFLDTYIFSVSKIG
jgi:hypothetical protein